MAIHWLLWDGLSGQEFTTTIDSYNFGNLRMHIWRCSWILWAWLQADRWWRRVQDWREVKRQRHKEFQGNREEDATYQTLRRIQILCSLAITFVPRLQTSPWVNRIATNTPLWNSNYHHDQNLHKPWSQIQALTKFAMSWRKKTY